MEPDALAICLLLTFSCVGACASNPTPRCATVDDCTRGSSCYRGFCLAGGPVDANVAPDAGACGAGQTLCGHDCVYLQIDEQHCGSCDTHCPHGGSCSFGHCGT